MATVVHRSFELEVLGSYETSIKGAAMVVLFPWLTSDTGWCQCKDVG